MNGISLYRIGALALRYLYLLRSSRIRIIELAYWPTVQMILWGFITQYLMTHSSILHQAAGLLLSGVLLWDVLFRSQLGLSVVFFEEMHARNLAQLLISPLQPIELIIALMSISLVRTMIGVGIAVLLAIPFYGFNLFTLGPPLIGFFFNLRTAIGRLFSQPAADGLGDRLTGIGAGVALRDGRREHRLGGDFCAGSSLRHLLSRRHPARLAATTGLGPAGQLRIRGDAGGVAGSRLPAGLSALCVAVEHRLSWPGHWRVPGHGPQGAGTGITVAVGGMREDADLNQASNATALICAHMGLPGITCK